MYFSNLCIQYTIFTNQIGFEFMKLLMFTTGSSCDLYVFEHHSCFSAAKLTEITINLTIFKDVRPQLLYCIPIHSLMIDNSV